MNEIAKMLTTNAEKSVHEQTVALYSDLLTTMYDKTTAYLNAITVGGYAAFFGLWSLLGSDLPPKQRFWSALLIGVSVLFFVGFEIVKAAILHWQMRHMMRISQTPFEPLNTQLQKRKAQYDQAHRKMQKIAVGIWFFVFPATIITGLGGALVMLYAFALKLWSL